MKKLSILFTVFLLCMATVFAQGYDPAMDQGGDPHYDDPNAQGHDPNMMDDPNAQGGDPYYDDPNQAGGDPYYDDPYAQGHDPNMMDDPNAQGGDPYYDDKVDDPNAQGGDPYYDDKMDDPNAAGSDPHHDDPNAQGQDPNMMDDPNAASNDPGYDQGMMYDPQTGNMYYDDFQSMQAGDQGADQGQYFEMDQQLIEQKFGDLPEDEDMCKQMVGAAAQRIYELETYVAALEEAILSHGGDLPPPPEDMKSVEEMMDMMPPPDDAGSQDQNQGTNLVGNAIMVDDSGADQFVGRVLGFFGFGDRMQDAGQEEYTWDEGSE